MGYVFELLETILQRKKRKQKSLFSFSLTISWGEAKKKVQILCRIDY